MNLIYGFGSCFFTTRLPKIFARINHILQEKSNTSWEILVFSNHFNFAKIFVEMEYSLDILSLLLEIEKKSMSEIHQLEVIVDLGDNISETRNSRKILHSYLMGGGHHRNFLVLSFFLPKMKLLLAKVCQNKSITHLINEMREQVGVSHFFPCMMEKNA